MNERLKEMAVKAGLRFTQLMSNPMVPVVDGKETDLEKFAEYVIAAEQEEREWCGNADNPIKCIGHNDLCRGFTCKHFAEFLHEKNRTLSIEINRLKTSKDICGND